MRFYPSLDLNSVGNNGFSSWYSSTTLWWQSIIFNSFMQALYLIGVKYFITPIFHSFPFLLSLFLEVACLIYWFHFIRSIKYYSYYAWFRILLAKNSDHWIIKSNSKTILFFFLQIIILDKNFKKMIKIASIWLGHLLSFQSWFSRINIYPPSPG
jgi:hypothetical protein